MDHKVTLVTEDNETLPQPAVQAARKMVDADDASCIAGAWASADTIPTFESVTSREGVLQISPASTSDEIAELDDPDGLMNRTVTPDAFQGPTLADYMEAGARRSGGPDRQRRRPQRRLRDGTR